MTQEDPTEIKLCSIIVLGFGHNHHRLMFPILALPADLLQQKKGNLLAHWSTNPTIPGLSNIKMQRFRAIYSLLSPTLLPPTGALICSDSVLLYNVRSHILIF